MPSEMKRLKQLEEENQRLKKPSRHFQQFLGADIAVVDAVDREGAHLPLNSPRFERRGRARSRPQPLS